MCSQYNVARRCMILLFNSLLLVVMLSSLFTITTAEEGIYNNDKNNTTKHEVIEPKDTNHHPIGIDDSDSNNLISLFREKLKNLGPEEEDYDEEEIQFFINNENLLRRFLIARHNNLDKAYDMAMATIRWRSTTKPSKITLPTTTTKNDDSSMLNLYDKTTKDGLPILYIPISSFSSSSTTDNEDDYFYNDDVRRIIYFMEQTNTSNEKLFVIVDMKDYSPRSIFHITKILRQHIIPILTNYYPERLGFAAFIHCDWIFDKAFRLLTRWMDNPTIQQKLYHFRDDGKDFLKQHILK